MKSLVSNYIRFAVKRHKLVVLLAIALLAASLALASDLSVDSSMQGILPENNEIITAMTIMDEEFGSQDDIIVAVKSGGSRETVISFLDALAQGISEKGLAKSLIYKIDLGGEITYLVSDSGNLYLMNISPNIDFSNLVEDRERFFAGMQEVLDKTLAMPQFAGLEAGMTGGNLIQDFESDKGLTSGFLFTGILTLAVIILIFALSFKRPLLPLATALPLVLGVALAAAVASIAFGGLNIFSMCFAVLLLGMGIDYAIHILSRYGEQRMSGDGLEEALTHTIEKTGMSMLIGTATTALTFLSFLFAKMNAFEQMGIISALGIFLAMGSQILVTPALIAWADLKKSKNEKKYAGAAAFRFMEPVGKLCARHGIALAIITVGVMAALFPNVRNVSVNGDVSSLYPDSLPSLKWLEMVKEEFEYNPDEISLMANDIDQLYIMTSELNALESIGTVDSIAQYLPEDKALREATLAYLPDAVKDKYIGKTGKFLIKVTANGDIWDSDRIAKVREDLSSITPYLGGMPVLMDEVVGIVIDDAILCSGLAALAILIILLVMFRSLKLAFLAFLPIAATVYFLFGLLPVFGGELTLTSVIAIPLVIGIGVSGAVHITNRVKATNDIPSTLVFTGKAVILSAVTTLIGFGSLMFSGHPALADLGLVVTGGLSISLLLNLVLLPAILGIGMSKPKR